MFRMIKENAYNIIFFALLALICGVGHYYITTPLQYCDYKACMKFLDTN